MLDITMGYGTEPRYTFTPDDRLRDVAAVSRFTEQEICNLLGKIILDAPGTKYEIRAIREGE